MNAIELERAAQTAAEERLAACQEVLFGDENGIGTDVESGASGPFCGCDTCVVREVLDAAWPHMLELARLELLTEDTA